MGRNYDWDREEEVSLVVHTTPSKGYASVGVSDVGFLGVENGFSSVEEKERTLYAPFYVTDGINEKGLACTVLVLDEKGAYQKNDKTEIISSLLVRLLLDKAATVADAEKVLGEYDIVSAFYMDKSEDPNGGKNFHWLVTDKTGDAAVFEVVDNKLVVNRTPIEITTDFSSIESVKDMADFNSMIDLTYPKEDLGYQLVTNFYVSEGAENTVGEGYWRYQTLKNLLKKNPNPTNEEAMDYLKAVRFFENDFDTELILKSQGKDTKDDDNWAWLTVVSEVYDTEDLSVNISVREKYEETYKFTIK